MKEAQLHLNQYSNGRYGLRNVVFGRQLDPGEVLEETDVYDSTSGNWDPCPVPGLPIGEGNTATWVRPQ